MPALSACMFILLPVLPQGYALGGVAGGLSVCCSCPIHRGDGRGRTFSVNLDDNVFCCFDARCGQQGDVIDLWAALHRMELRDAALDLVRTFDLEPAPPQRTEKRNG
jgi:DNA primase